MDGVCANALEGEIVGSKRTHKRNDVSGHCCGKSVSSCRAYIREFRVSVTLIETGRCVCARENGDLSETSASLSHLIS